MFRQYSTIWLRPLAYLLLLLALFGGLVYLEIHGSGMGLQVMTPASPVYGTSEYSWPENLQLLLLLVSVFLAAHSARMLPVQRPVSMVLLALASAAFVRECDWYLDKFVYDHTWQLLLGLIVVSTAVYLLRRPNSLRVAVSRVQSSVGLALIGSAIAGVLVFSAMIGTTPLWEALLGDDYSRIAKLAAEELSELFCYWLWCIGQCEYWIDCRRRSGYGRS